MLLVVVDIILRATIFYYSLIQAVLGCLSINDSSLNQEAVRVISIGERLMKGKKHSYLFILQNLIANYYSLIY